MNYADQIEEIRLKRKQQAIESAEKERAQQQAWHEEETVRMSELYDEFSKLVGQKVSASKELVLGTYAHNRDLICLGYTENSRFDSIPPAFIPLVGASWSRGDYNLYTSFGSSGSSSSPNVQKLKVIDDVMAQIVMAIANR